tara:strand:- start:19194 stop:19400 length:207 start_codon:yes stop_codon:yes gene_type:complete
MIISTYFKEDAGQRARAEVVKNPDGTHKIDYYNISGDLFHEEYFPNKSVFYVEDAAKNWASGIKVLNG